MVNERLVHALNAQHIALINGYWPWRGALKNAKSRAKQKGISFDLSDDWARVRYTGYCELSGIAFSTQLGKRNIFSLSIDRIESNEGYTQSNSRFILWGLNAMRGDNGSDEDILKICRALLDAW